jgi:predicted protein tyrosine phosphatase
LALAKRLRTPEHEIACGRFSLTDMGKSTKPTNSKIGPGRGAGDLHVCPMCLVHETLARTGARHLITVINHQTMLETPPSIAANNHLKLAINDITEPQDGLIHPTPKHVDALVRFALNWDRQGPLVIHCWAGISRSTAAAFITLCALNPDVPEHLLARRLREASATASPNRLLVRLADARLSRCGRMVTAIEEIGPGQMAVEGQPFTLPSRLA